MKEIKITRTTLNLATGEMTTMEVTGKELEQWKRKHGYVDTKNKSQSDTDRETDSDPRESE